MRGARGCSSMGGHRRACGLHAAGSGKKDRRSSRAHRTNRERVCGTEAGGGDHRRSGGRADEWPVQCAGGECAERAGGKCGEAGWDPLYAGTSECRRTEHQFREERRKLASVPRFLFLDGANPVFASPKAWKVREAISQVPYIVSFGNFIDETSVMADLILPDHSFLESWVQSAPESGAKTRSRRWPGR